MFCTLLMLVNVNTITILKSLLLRTSEIAVPNNELLRINLYGNIHQILYSWNEMSYLSIL